MNKNIIMSDISEYKTFIVAGKFGIRTWCDRLILAPICVERPNIGHLEDYGYTFIKLESGINLINEEGLLLLNENMVDAGWLIQNKIVAFKRKDGTEGIYFVKEEKYIYNLTDAEPKTEYIETENGKKHGVVTYWGKEIFVPNYSAVAIFDNNIYIAYNDDGTALLNSPEWKAPTKSAMTDSFFRSRSHGILAKFVSEGWKWVDRETGEFIPDSSLTMQQKLNIKTAIEKAIEKVKMQK